MKTDRLAGERTRPGDYVHSPRVAASGADNREGSAVDSHETNEGDRRRVLDREIERYREAALNALDQLEWCIEYLHRVRKPEIARVLARNRKQILERLP